MSIVRTSDRVDVVRCENCKYGVPCRDMVDCLNAERGPEILVDPEWFCADGERREDEHGNSDNS